MRSAELVAGNVVVCVTFVPSCAFAQNAMVRFCGFCRKRWQPSRHGKGHGRKAHVKRLLQHTRNDACPPLHDWCYQKSEKEKVLRVLMLRFGVYRLVVCVFCVWCVAETAQHKPNVHTRHCAATQNRAQNARI